MHSVQHNIFVTVFPHTSTKSVSQKCIHWILMLTFKGLRWRQQQSNIYNFAVHKIILFADKIGIKEVKICEEKSTLMAQCLDFCQALTNRCQGFNCSLSISNSFSFSLDTRVNSPASKGVHNEAHILFNKN